MDDYIDRTGYFFRTEDDIDFTPTEYSYFRSKEELDSFVAWFDHVQNGYVLADLKINEDHNFVKRLYLKRKKYKKFFDHLCEFDQPFNPLPVTHLDGRVQLFDEK